MICQSETMHHLTSKSVGRLTVAVRNAFLKGKRTLKTQASNFALKEAFSRMACCSNSANSSEVRARLLQPQEEREKLKSNVLDKVRENRKERLTPRHHRR